MPFMYFFRTTFFDASEKSCYFIGVDRQLKGKRKKGNDRFGDTQTIPFRIAQSSRRGENHHREL